MDIVQLENSRNLEATNWKGSRNKTRVRPTPYEDSGNNNNGNITITNDTNDDDMNNPLTV